MRFAPIAVVLAALLVAMAGGVALAGDSQRAPKGDAGKPARAPVALRISEQAHGNVLLRWRVRRDLHTATVRVNGHRAWVRPLLRAGQRGTYSLDAADGLRFGRNRIAVALRLRGGKRVVLRRAVELRRDAPLPAILQPRRAVSSQAIRLDGRRSRPAQGGKLHYRWRILRGPAGSHATLRGAGSRRPALLADSPGHYRLALTVRERGGAKDPRPTASAAPCSVLGSPPPPLGKRRGPLGSTALDRLPPGSLTVNPRGRAKRGPLGPLPRAASGCATDVETVKVKPNVEPIGVAFDSRAEFEGQTGIRVGTDFFTLPGSGEGARFVLFDAQTLEVLSSVTASPGRSAQRYAEALALPWSSEHEVLIVAAGLAGCCPADSEDSSQGFTLIENFVAGGGTPSENQGQPLAEGGGDLGAMSGWLQPGIPLDGAAELYAFVSPERAQFDTQASGSTASANTIQIGAKIYPAQLPAGAGAGYEVLVTNSALEPLFGSPTAFGTVGPQAEAEEQAMASLIYRAAQADEATVFVQSIGNPTPSSPAAAGIANLLETMGANRWLFLSLDGSGGYAFVGTADAAAFELGATSAEASSQWSRRAGGGNAGGEGALRGVLRRTKVSAYAPFLAGALEAPNYGLAEVAYQPSVPWPQTENGGRAAATRWIAEALELTPGPGSCYQPPQPDFRSSYCDDSLSPLALQREVEKLTYPAKQEGSFSRQEFEAVQAQLQLELGYVADVRALVATLREPLGEQNPAVEASKVAAEVIEAIPAPRTSATSGNLGLASSIFYAASEVPEVGEALGPIGAILDIASQLTQEGGQPSPDWTIQASAGEIGSKVQKRLRLMSGSLGSTADILVSDWGKLSTAATAAKGKWGISQQGVSEEASTIELGISQWMWTAITPAAFELVAFDLADFPGAREEPGSELYCVYSRAPEEWYPWRSASPRSVLYPLATFESGRARNLVAFGMLSGSYAKKGSPAVSESLANKIFGSPNQGGAALIAPWLLERARWNIVEPKMIDEENSPLVPGWCGIGSS
jgi:hypothetical protein